MADVVLAGLNQDGDKNGIVSQNEECEFIGLEYVRAYSAQRGIDTEIINPSLDPEQILNKNPAIVGFSVMGSNYVPTKELGKKLKQAKPDINIVWGGPHATTYFKEGLERGLVDYIVLGEGEKTFYELASGLLEGKPVGSLEGIASYDENSVDVAPKRQRLTGEEIDSIEPEVLHQREDYGVYFAKQIPHSVPASEMNFAMISGSRGCWNNCSFCSSNSMWGRNTVYRSPEKIVDELEYLVNDKGVNFVFFGDDDFLINGSWAKGITQGIVDRGIKTSLHAMASVKSSSRFNDYDLLKRAGIKELTIGMESTNQKIIDDMGKGYDINTLPTVASEITGHGIHFGLYYMLGYPGQTEEDLDRDYDFIKGVPFSRIRAVFATPYPETNLYRQVEKEGLWLDGCRNNWSALTNDKPVIKTPVAPEQLIEARKKVLGLYFSEDYGSHMKAMYQGDAKSEQAFNEFQSFTRGVV